jgi:hypothetical protein
MSEDNNQKDTIINDRRRIDEQGQERGGAQAVDAAANFTMSEAQPEATTEPEINFVSFVVSLATQALMQMGQMSPPPGVDLKKDKNGARQTIEILSMLEKKTRGNLEKEEASLIEEVLHNLRMSFLKL